VARHYIEESLCRTILDEFLLPGHRETVQEELQPLSVRWITHVILPMTGWLHFAWDPKLEQHDSKEGQVLSKILAAAGNTMKLANLKNASRVFVQLPQSPAYMVPRWLYEQYT